MTRIDRRLFLGAALASGALPARAAPAAAPLRLIAGTYANEHGAGLVPLAYHADGDRWTTGTPVGSIANASYGIYSSRFRRHYLLDEQDVGSLAGYDAHWARQGQVSTGGNSPCYVTLDARQSCLAVANYGTGNVALIRLDAAGRPQAAQLVQHHGHGPNKDRQTGPHAHWVGFSPDQRWLHSVDLGADAIFAHGFDARTGTLSEGKIAYHAPAGTGPRHLVRHPHLPRAYLVSELANTVTVLEVGTDGSFRAVATHSTLPAGFTAHSQAAHIALDAAAKRLYASNRGHDSIAVYAVAADGGLSLLQHAPSGGKWPRAFLLLERERRLLVANEHSGTVAVLRVEADGKLSDTGQPIAIPGVVFLAPDPAA